jgi:hypothetical protein
MPRYPDIEPYETGLLDTGDGNLVYWEACGNPDGVPALIVHPVKWWTSTRHPLLSCDCCD